MFSDGSDASITASTLVSVLQTGTGFLFGLIVSPGLARLLALKLNQALKAAAKVGRLGASQVLEILLVSERLSSLHGLVQERTRDGRNQEPW